ncbi:MAG: hypothetical protein AB9844_12930 [Clostridiaceae bacterium]
MRLSKMFIPAALIALFFVVFLVFISKKERKINRLTPLASLAFGCVLAGMFFFRQNLYLGYGLLGIGIIFSIIDIVNKTKASR